jgi:eukaryotic-like serine/threonine-protein kinase
VAMKVIRVERDSAGICARFLREARVQGQLEHPSIVPVYDLDVGPDGAIYFTMKRVLGLTLADVIDGLRANDPSIVPHYSRRKLLTAFGSVCLAIEFAHSRGVIHRDLKPENVMLGDFGEVYVLDWGVAKVTGETDDGVFDQDQASTVKTAVGSYVGTLGYMSPEQRCGTDVDERSDVYGLGAILFELLTLEPLHSGNAGEVSASTVSGVDARASIRAPKAEVPPELELLCVKATALDPEDRPASARDLQQAVERYLDGDRDVERRRELSMGHALTAKKLLGSTLNSLGAEDRALAMREVGRAVALDPLNEVALTTMATLLLEPPRETPPEVQASIDASRAKSQNEVTMAGFVTYAGFLLLFLPITFFMGLREWGWMIAASSFLALTSIGCWIQGRWPSRAKSYAILACSAIAFACIGRICGPLVLVPTAALGMSAGYGLHPDRGVRGTAWAMMSSAFLVPLLLEATGVLPSSYRFTNGEITVIPHMTELAQLPSLVFVSTGTMLMLIATGKYVGRVSDALRSAEAKLFLQAWQLGQLVPSSSKIG